MPPALTRRQVFRLWFPLAASWALMGAEGPLFTYFVAHLPEQKVNLAAFGSITFPVALVVEGPIIMLLAASTALCRDWTSYRKVRRFTLVAAAALTALHAAIAFTPLYHVVAGTIIGAPEEVRAPGRLGLQLMLPWTGAIAYRRFLQGLLIRYHASRMVMFGTVVRLVVLVSALWLGSRFADWPGIAVGSFAISCGVVAEALFARWSVGPVLRERLPRHDPDAEPLHRRRFLAFYLPLALTPLITLFIQPAGAAAMSRMPEAALSLAAWQVVHAIVFLTRSTGFALNEVVVAQLDRPGARPALRSFTLMLALATSGALALIALTPLADLLFRGVFGLAPDLARVCRVALLFALVMPAYQALQSWYQGRLVHRGRTRGVTEAVVLYAAVALVGLGAGARWSTVPGIYWALATFTLGGILQTLWLARRARAVA